MIPTQIGFNPRSQYYGQVEGVQPSSHFDLVIDIGGADDLIGDYLYRDQASLGSYQGLWGLIRFNEIPAQPQVPAVRPAPMPRAAAAYRP